MFNSNIYTRGRAWVRLEIDWHIKSMKSYKTLVKMTHRARSQRTDKNQLKFQKNSNTRRIISIYWQYNAEHSKKNFNLNIIIKKMYACIFQRVCIYELSQWFVIGVCVAKIWCTCEYCSMINQFLRCDIITLALATASGSRLFPRRVMSFKAGFVITPRLQCAWMRLSD